MVHLIQNFLVITTMSPNVFSVATTTYDMQLYTKTSTEAKFEYLVSLF